MVLLYNIFFEMIAKCSVSSCQQICSESTLLKHMIWDHIHHDLSNLEEIKSNERTVLCFDEKILNCGGNVCLGVLLYARNGLVLI